LNDAKNVINVVVSPVDGTFTGLPAKRNYRVIINNVYDPTSVLVDGVAVKTWSYLADTLAIEVDTGSIDVTKGTKVSVTLTRALDKILLSGIPLAINRLKLVKELIDNQWNAVFQEDYEHVILAASTGDRIARLPGAAVAEITQFSKLYATALAEVAALSSNTKLSPAIQQKALALLTTAQPVAVNRLSIGNNSL